MENEQQSESIRIVIADDHSIVREGLRLTASAGVAPNKFLAKVASDWRKPDGLFVIQPEDVDTFLPRLPVGRIPGVGKVTEARLKQLGIRTVGDLQRIPLAQLQELLLSARKAKKKGQKLFDHTSKKLFWCMAIPLGAGGLFCIALLTQGLVIMVAPVMLLFYGTALVSASRYTMSDVRFLGILEIITGLASAFLPGYGLWFWAVGFGLLHIVYGSIIWFKYDRTEQ